MVNLERYAKGYVQITDEGLIIDWEKIASLDKSGIRAEKILMLLLEHSILSSELEVNWSVDLGSANCNPRITSSPGRMKLYFTDWVNAREYAHYAFPQGGYEIYRL